MDPRATKAIADPPGPRATPRPADGGARFGACRPPDDAALAARHGWDFLELPFGQLGVLDDARRAPASPSGSRAGMRAESFHRFLPAQLRLVGDDLDRDAVQRYVETALARVAAIGGRLARRLLRLSGRHHRRWLLAGAGA